jgi:hypothetical protein
MERVRRRPWKTGGGSRYLIALRSLESWYWSETAGQH